MSRRANPEDDESTLFDLPLHRSESSEPPAGESEPDAERPRAAVVDEPFGELPESPAEAAASPPAPETAARGPRTPVSAAPVSAAPMSAAPVSAAPVDEARDDESRVDVDDAGDGGALVDAPPGPEPTRAAEAPNISFAMTLPFGDKEKGPVADRAGPAESRSPVPAGFGSLFLAGLVDLGLIFVGLVTAVLGAAGLGSPPGPGDWPALLVLGLTVSFPYYVVPLAFWGRSAGMAAFSLFARSRDGRPLSFRQAVIRWFAAWITVGTAGLAGLVALTGRSLADRLSATRTLSRH